MFDECKILTASLNSNGEVTLTITSQDFLMEAGDRFKFVRTDEGFLMRRLWKNDVVKNRRTIEKDQKKLFDHLRTIHPRSQVDKTLLLHILLSSCRYAWMICLENKIEIEATDLQSLFALTDAEMNEYETIKWNTFFS